MTLTKVNKLPIFLSIAASVIFLFAAFRQHGDGTTLPDAANKILEFGRSRPSFYEIAIKTGTDKVTDHSYHHMYQKYLPALRNRKIKMLEIGLGCDMSYGPGASYHLWLEYFPNVDLHFIEHDAACAKKYRQKTTGATIHTGDQADATFLEDFIAETGGDFDIIIDDGGHTMTQQRTSLFHLFKAVVPGGVYFCEDLQTSYIERYGGGAEASAESPTMVRTIADMIEDMNGGGRRQTFEEAEEVLSIDCMHEVCAFRKRGLGS